MLMTDLSRIALLGAVALLAAACAKEVGTDNPNFNAETNEVKTNFVFNVSTAQETKQSSAATQAISTATFRGIDNAALLTYAEPTGTKILSADKDANKFYDLAAVAAPAQLSASDSRRVLELSLPIQTNVMLFYGKAPYGEPDGTYPNKYDYYGHMDAYSIGEDAGSADFEAGKRLSSTDYVQFKTVENLFAGIMSMLLNTTLKEGLTISKDAYPDGVSTKYKYDATLVTDINWEAYTDNSGNSPYANPAHARYPLEDKLALVYSQLTNINTAGGELRAGSGIAVIRMARDLFTVLNEVRCAEPTNASEAVAKYFANVVFNRMLKYYSATYTGDGAPVSNVAFNSAETIAAAYLTQAEIDTRPSDKDDASVWPNATALASISTREPANFPTDFNIPRGATYIAFDAVKKRFYYPQSFNVSGMGVPGSGDTYNALSYFYPAELLYFGNSPIRTSNADKQVADYPHIAGSTSTGSWEKDASWSADWSGSAVEASTRAVAMKYDINYGVALLASRVRFTKAAYDAGYINDNNHNVQVEWHGASAEGEKDKPVPITTDGAFQVTGLIIGGQSEYIGWDHLPYNPGSGYKYGFLYDKAIPADSKSVPYSYTTASNWNYTLVYDNFHAASQSAGIYTPEASQDKVYVAVEFQNNTGKDFYGNHNLIQAGGHFYLIGCLDPASGGDITWPTNYVIPPYNADGTSQEVKRIFIQDYMTSATFTLDMNSLHAAYLTVPDLRASSMTLGLSVDLEWRTGLSFDNVVLGQ